MEEKYFISDTHFGHANIIASDGRPFESVNEMDSFIIHSWNNKVKEEDTVYILGDLAWYNNLKTSILLHELKGHKILIRGNHDRINGNCINYFDEIVDYKEIKINDDFIVLSHYPILFYNKHSYGAYHLYGHVHNAKEYLEVLRASKELKKKGMENKILNVGCMMPYMNYEPQSFEVLKNVIDRSGDLSEGDI